LLDLEIVVGMNFEKTNDARGASRKALLKINGNRVILMILY